MNLCIILQNTSHAILDGNTKYFNIFGRKIVSVNINIPALEPQLCYITYILFYPKCTN